MKKKTRYKKNLPKKRSWIHRVEMSLVENVHHYFLCILASTHSFIYTTLSSSSKHQARASSKLFHLIFGNKTPKCKFNVIFFSWFSVMLTLGTYRYSTICSMPPPQKKIFKDKQLFKSWFFRRKSMGNFNRWNLPMGAVKFCEDWSLSRFLSLQYLSINHYRTIFLRIFHDLCFILFRE